MKAIAAMAENRAIGKDRGLPWKSPIKEDFRWFKEFTTNKILIVGRKTFDTLPFLRDRNIIVLCRDSEFRNTSIYNAYYNMGACALYYDEIITLYYDRIVKLYSETYSNKDKLIVAGGAKTYEMFFPHITEFYVTHVRGSFEADTFMPPFEHLFSKQEVVKEFDGHRVIKYSK